MISIAKTFEFSASHRLAREDWDDAQNQKVYGKCANPNGHGHNYRLEVIVSGEVDKETGMVFDASTLDALVQEHLLQFVDHRNLNSDVEWFAGKVPTAEVIVDTFWEQLSPVIKNAPGNAILTKLILHETSRIYAIRTDT